MWGRASFALRGSLGERGCSQVDERAGVDSRKVVWAKTWLSSPGLCSRGWGEPGALNGPGHTWALLALAMADIMATRQDSSSLANWAARMSTARRSWSLSISTQRNMARALYWPAPFLVHSFSHLFNKLGGCVYVYVWEGNVLIIGMWKELLFGA